MGSVKNGKAFGGKTFGCLFHFASQHALCYMSCLSVFHVCAPSKQNCEGKERCHSRGTGEVLEEHSLSLPLFI